MQQECSIEQQHALHTRLRRLCRGEAYLELYRLQNKTISPSDNKSVVTALRLPPVATQLHRAPVILPGHGENPCRGKLVSPIGKIQLRVKKRHPYLLRLYPLPPQAAPAPQEYQAVLWTASAQRKRHGIAGTSLLRAHLLQKTDEPPVRYGRKCGKLHHLPCLRSEAPLPSFTPIQQEVRAQTIRRRRAIKRPESVQSGQSPFLFREGLQVKRGQLPLARRRRAA